MPNIATALRDEIKRLSRQQSRTQMDPTKKATAIHRRDIALLKRQVILLERQVKSLMRRSPKRTSAPQTRAPGLKVRFVPKGLRSQRDRLGLSAEGLGKVLGVSAQSVYNWKAEKLVRAKTRSQNFHSSVRWGSAKSRRFWRNRRAHDWRDKVRDKQVFCQFCDAAADAGKW